MPIFDKSSTYSGVLLCGGEGTRLREITDEYEHVPKPLLPVHGKPLIQYTSDQLVANPAIAELILATKYKSEQVESWAESVRERQVRVSHQTTPGVLGAILAAAETSRESGMVVANTDEIRFGLDVSRALAFHDQHSMPVTLVTAIASNLYRHRIIGVGDGNVVTSTIKQPTSYISRPEARGVVNAGVLIGDKQTLAEYGDFSHGKDWDGVLAPLIDDYKLAAYICPGMTFINVGTPPEYHEAQTFFAQKCA